MAEIPVVSVVIPTYNRAHLVSRAIRSALAQDYPALEVIVVDDGSTDNTHEVLSRFDSIRSIRFEINRGGAIARNAGIEAANGQFVAFLDSDDEWLPEKTRRQMDLLLGSHGTGAVYCRHFAHDDASGTRVETFPTLYRDSIREALFSGECPHTVSLFLVRREALMDAGGFDPSLAGFQDTDLWIRLSERWDFDAVDEALVVVHSHSGVRVTTDPQARERALDAFFDKWREPMTQSMGAAGIAAYRRRNMAVAQGAHVLSLVETGKRARAWRELFAYLQIAGVSNPAQAGGLILACLFGTRIHSRLRVMFRSARRKAWNLG